MHEWALAEGVISTALKVAGEEKAKEIVRIRVKVGELQQVDEGILEFALEGLAKGTMVEKARIEITSEKSILKCRVCGHEWAFGDSREKLGREESEALHFLPYIAPIYIRCPGCGSPDFEIKRGRGVWVDSIQIKK